jgi:hypothetical protein
MFVTVASGFGRARGKKSVTGLGPTLPAWLLQSTPALEAQRSIRKKSEPTGGGVEEAGVPRGADARRRGRGSADHLMIRHLLHYLFLPGMDGVR